VIMAANFIFSVMESSVYWWDNCLSLLLAFLVYLYSIRGEGFVLLLLHQREELETR